MNITITGPRSVGKSTISKIVAKKLKLKYISSDNLGNKALKKQGGLDKAIKSGVIFRFIKKKGYNLINKVYKNNKNFVFDLSGGSVSSNTLRKASEKVRQTAKKNSIVVGLLPSKKVKESVNFLFKREVKRKHFKKMDRKELFDKVKRHYTKMPPLFKTFCNYIVYVKGRTKNNIVNEIVELTKR